MNRFVADFGQVGRIVIFNISLRPERQRLGKTAITDYLELHKPSSIILYFILVIII